MTAERTRVRRLPEKQRRDRQTLDAVLDAARVAHVAVVDAGQPFVVPVACARDGDTVLIHGSTGSRLFRRLAAGGRTCLTVTMLDGLVLARSAFESSMHYRSAMILGSCTVVPEHRKEAALRVLTDHLLPGRWPEVRSVTKRELAATLVLELPIVEWSVKVSDGPPGDDPADAALPIWAGVLPITGGYGDPVPAPELSAELPLPDSVRHLLGGGLPGGSR